MKKPLIIEPEAEADLLAAYEWYEQQRPGLGADLVLCVEAAIEVVTERPRSFPRAWKNARRMLVNRFPYLVLFIERKTSSSFSGYSTPAEPRGNGDGACAKEHKRATLILYRAWPSAALLQDWL